MHRMAIVLALMAQFGDRRVNRHIGRGIEDSVRALGTYPLRWTLGDAGRSSMSVVGPREIPWQEVRDVFLAHGIWVVTQRSRQVMVIPDEAFTEPADRFFLSRVRAAGARVRPPDDLRERYDVGPL